MADQQRKPASDRRRRALDSFTGSESGEGIPLQIVNERPASASTTSSVSMMSSSSSNSNLESLGAELPQMNKVEIPQKAAKESAKDGASVTKDSTFSLPVLKSGPASAVSLLENRGVQGSEQGQLQEIHTPVHMRVTSDYERPPEYSAAMNNKIQHLLYLTEGETDFDSDKEIPDIFAQVDQRDRYSTIKDLQGQLEGDGVKAYSHRFERDMQEGSLLVGKMSREQVEEQERGLQLEHLAYQQQEAAKQQERQRQIVISKENARREVSKTVRRRKRALKRKQAEVAQASMVHSRQLYSAYNTAQKQMIKALKARKAEVKTLYGDLQRTGGCYSGVKGRRWKVDWSRAPQPVQIKLKSLRGVRDKLPGGRYVLLVSLYDRVGGHVLRWSKLKGQQWAASTVPVDHCGHYYNTEIKLDQSVYTVLPPRLNVRPSMILVFELFILQGVVSPTDCVVGWGVFPVCDPQFRTIEGKYKCPFLRGPVDPRVTKHAQIERLMASDLENWLCNMYFEIVKLPRYLSGMHEYEVELQFTSSLLGLPKPSVEDESGLDNLPSTENGTEPTHGTAVEEHSGTSEVLASHLPVSSNEDISAPLEGISVPEFSKSSVPRHPFQARQSRELGSASFPDSDSDGPSEEGVREHTGSEFKPVTDQPGLYYKVHTFDPVEEKQHRSQAMYPHTPLLRGRGRSTRENKPLSEGEELQQHTMAVKRPFSDGIKKKRRINERVQYIGRQLLSEFGPSQWRTLQFWSLVVILVLSWWIRLYLHYVAQYAFLRAIRIPVNRFEFYAHTVVLNYQSNLLFTRESIAIILLGPLFNTMIFCLFVLLSWLIQKLFGSFPDLASQFILAFGIQAFLDPYWIFIVDMALLRFQAPLPNMQTADVTKLYWHFDRLEGNGVIGVFLLLFLYLLVSFLTLACLYMFFLQVHKNGHLIDVYQRLRSPEELFFVPRDLEISNQELSYVCRKAEQWRGADGERRKVVVYDYVWTDDQTDSGTRTRTGKQVTSHMSIHTLHLDGLRELYRQFLRLEDGSIIEVFGELSKVPGISPSLKNALTTKHQATEPSSQDIPAVKVHITSESTSVTHHELQLPNEGGSESDSASVASLNESSASVLIEGGLAGHAGAEVEQQSASSGQLESHSDGAAVNVEQSTTSLPLNHSTASLHAEGLIVPEESAGSNINHDVGSTFSNHTDTYEATVHVNTLNDSTVIELESSFEEHTQVEMKAQNNTFEKQLSAGQLV